MMDRWHAVLLAVFSLVVALVAGSCRGQQRNDGLATIFDRYPHVGPHLDEIREDEQNGKPPAHAVPIDRALQSPATYRGRRVGGKATVRTVVSSRVFFVGGSDQHRLGVAVGPRVRRPELKAGERVHLQGRLVDGRSARIGLSADLGVFGELTLREQDHVLLIMSTDTLSVVSRRLGGTSGGRLGSR